MRFEMKYPAIMFLLLMLSACATPYKKAVWLKEHDVGYTNKQVSKNKFEIKYFGHEWDDMWDLVKLWHRRADQLCPNGYSNEKLKRKYHKVIRFDGFIPYVNKYPYVEGEVVCK